MSVIVSNTRRIIRERGLRQNYVADKAGIEEKVFSALLSGKKLIREEHIIAIANALEVTPNDLLFNETDPRTG